MPAADMGVAPSISAGQLRALAVVTPAPCRRDRAGRLSLDPTNSAEEAPYPSEAELANQNVGRYGGLNMHSQWASRVALIFSKAAVLATYR
jgi:hypothetical protein